MPQNPNPLAFRSSPALFRALFMAGLALGAAQATTVTVNTINMDLVNNGGWGS